MNRNEYKKKKNEGPSDPSAYGRMVQTAEDKRETKLVKLEHSGFVLEIIQIRPVEVLSIWEVLGTTEVEAVEAGRDVEARNMRAAKMVDGLDAVCDFFVTAGWIRKPKVAPHGYEKKDPKEKILLLDEFHKIDKESLYKAIMAKPEEEAIKLAASFRDDEGGTAGGADGAEKESVPDGSA